MKDILDSHRSLRLLEEISKGDPLTQRDLSDRLDMALGLVNAYLKTLVKKGCIKIAGIPPKRFKYYITPKGFIEKSRALWLRDPYIAPEAMARIVAPVLFVLGEQDAIRLDHVLEMRARVKQGHLCVLPSATHFVLREKPALILPILVDFLQIVLGYVIARILLAVANLRDGNRQQQHQPPQEAEEGGGLKQQHDVTTTTSGRGAAAGESHS